MLVAGFVGIAYLAVGLVRLVNGIQLEPVEVQIGDFERGVSANAEYLRVTGGAVVFSQADMHLRKTPDENGRRLVSIAAPVVSPEMLTSWNEALKRGEIGDVRRRRSG